LLSTSNLYARGANSCFLNQPLRWWYIPTLEVQTVAFLWHTYAAGTNTETVAF